MLQVELVIELISNTQGDIEYYLSPSLETLKLHVFVLLNNIFSVISLLRPRAASSPLRQRLAQVGRFQFATIQSPLQEVT